MHDAQDAALGHTDGFAGRKEWNFDVDRSVELDLDEVDVKELSAHRVKCEVADHRKKRLFGELELDDRVLSELAPKNIGHFFGLHGNRGRRQPLAVRDARDETRAPNAARSALPRGAARLGLQRGHVCFSHGKTPITRPRPPRGFDGGRTPSRIAVPAPRLRSGSAQVKSELTLSELWMRLMASPRSRAIETCFIFGQFFAASERAMVSLTTTSARGESTIR